MAQDLTKMLSDLTGLQALLPELRAALQQRAVQEAVEGGAAVVVRPEYFQKPVRAEKGKPGQTDPWFGLAQWDWNAEIEAGFSGWYAVTPGARSRVMINYEAAREWLAAKMRRQQTERGEAA